MVIDGEVKERLLRLSEKWGEAEQAIKIAEQAGGEVNTPAIMELRYAGRKLQRALRMYLEERDLTEADELVIDAINDCHRARHDATDAATASITLRVDAALSRLGDDAVIRAFPKLPDLIGKLGHIREKISNVRNRQDQRHDVYEDLEVNELPLLMQLYEGFRANEPRMRDQRIRRWFLKYGLNAAFLIMLIFFIYRDFAKADGS